MTPFCPVVFFFFREKLATLWRKASAFFETLPIPEIPTLVLAGTAGPRAGWLPLGHVPSDGVVTVEEARLERALLVEVGSLHTFIMNSGAVSKAATSFLRQDAYYEKLR